MSGGETTGGTTNVAVTGGMTFDTRLPRPTRDLPLTDVQANHPTGILPPDSPYMDVAAGIVVLRHHYSPALLPADGPRATLERRHGAVCT